MASRETGTGPVKKQASKEGIDCWVENTKDRTAGWNGPKEENTRIQVTPGRPLPMRNSGNAGFGGGTEATARGTRPLKNKFFVHHVK